MQFDGKGYTTTWRLFRVDSYTWYETEQIGFEAAQIIKSDEGTRESGTLTVSGDFVPGYYRLSMVIDGERFDVSTLYCKSSDSETNHGTTTYDVVGYSVLEPANKEKLFTGTYAPAGSDGAHYAATLLGGCLAAPVVVEGAFTLDTNIVFDGKSSVLACAEQVLDAGNFILQVDESGTVHVKPKPDTADIDISSRSKLLSPGINEHQTDDIPNRYIAVDGAATAIAVNDNPQSPTSVQAAGFYNDEIDERATRINSETLKDYANRMLAEKSVIKYERSYSRDFVPGVLPGSLVRMIDNLRVSHQELVCGKGITVNETSYKEIKTWPL